MAGRPLTFTTTGQPIDLELVPFYRSLDERYAAWEEAVKRLEQEVPA